ncbi:MAG: complex I NDUFA9 subunit family protein [Caulobacteraceae bacterium]
MKGLVTVFGGSGFVGAQVVRALAKAGWRIRVAVRNPGRGYRLPMLGDVGQIEIVQANIRDRPSIERALDGATACVNAVGILYESGRQSFAAIHHQGAADIAEAAANGGVRRFIQISALGASLDSASAYAVGKAAGEVAVRENLPSAVILRPSVVFGPDDAFFNRFAALATLSPALPLFGGGGTKLQPVYVGDVALAVVRALEDEEAGGKDYELGGPKVYTLRELMELTLRTIGRRRWLAPIPFAIARPLGAVGDILARFTPFAPPITSDQLALLGADNIVGPAGLGLAALGIVPTAAEPILPTYLYRYRRGGQYADLAGAAPAVLAGRATAAQ